VENLRILELIVAVFGGIAASYGAGLVVWRSVNKLFQAWHVVGDLYSEFGSHPVDELIAILQGIEATHGEIEIRQRLAERHLGFGIFVSTAEGQWSWANVWLCESFGVDSSELRNNGWLKVLKYEDQITEHEYWLRSIRDSLPYERSFIVEPHNGDEPWRANVEAWPVKDHDGKTICFVGYVARLK